MALISTVRDLHRRKARERRGLALAEGVRVVEEMLMATVPCKGAIVSPVLVAAERGRKLRDAIAALGIPVEELTDRELADAAATEQPQGVIAVYQPPRYAAESVRPGPGSPVVILDAVQDPGNVGTIIRTALAFGAAGVIALPGTVDLHSPKVVRSSAGAVFRLPLAELQLDALPDWLDRTGASLQVTAMDGVHPAGSDDRGVAVVLGNEGAGVSDAVMAMAERRITIPIAPEVESLNVGIAAAVILHELTATRRYR